jgi:hypothetical protein
MFGLIWALSARAHSGLRRFMPTNIVLGAIRTRRGLKWGLLAMLLAIPYSLAAALAVGLVDAGAPAWFYAIALLFVWNALKFIVAGPVTLIRLMVVRANEARARRLPTATHFDETQYTNQLTR